VVIIMSFALMTPEEARNYQAVTVFPDENNRLT
jgi:aspartate 1-decarboxylase